MHTADRWVVGLTLGYAAFLVLGSLVPLNWQPQSWGQAWQAFLALPGPVWRDDERVDVAVNFLLTVPLAFGLAHWAAGQAGAASRVIGCALVWPAAAVFSVGVEFAQTFFPPRDPSWTDVVAQCVGSAAGMALYAMQRQRFRRLLDGLGTHHPVQARSLQWLAIYLALLVVFSVMPLDLSISPVELYRKWRDGRMVLLPFGAPWQGAWQFVYDLCTDVALWVPVGLLWRTDGQGRSVTAVVARGLLAAALVECAQLFVLSRVSDVTDIILAGAGVALGAALPRALGGWAAWPPQRQARWLVGGLWLWLAVAVTIMWQPFDFSLVHVTGEQALGAFTRTPFETYAFRGEFNALNEIVRKLLVFFPGGLLLGALSLRRPSVAGAAPVAAIAVLALVLEAGQLFLPSKLADATDAALGALGALVGWGIARSLGPVVGRAATIFSSMPPAAPPPARPVVAASSPVAQWRVLAVLAALLWLGSRTPGLPYNVAKLMPPGVTGAVAALGLACTLWWMLVVPLWLLAPHRTRWRLAFPLLAPAHALVSFLVLYSTVPLVMIHKLIGYPVLGWGGPWEDMARYVALHCSVIFLVYGAALLVRTLQRPAAVVDLAYWCCAMLLLFWPLHWAVVEQAGTDNLVELMRGGGSLGASAALGLGGLLVAVCGSAAGAALVPGRRWAMLVVAGLAAGLAPLFFSAGLEQVLVKYGRAFSALQFILSVGRDSYAVGGELQLRAALALGLTVFAVAALQAPQWRALACNDGVRPTRGRAGLGVLPAA